MNALTDTATNVLLVISGTAIFLGLKQSSKTPPIGYCGMAMNRELAERPKWFSWLAVRQE
jgi:hypothetical protein